MAWSLQRGKTEGTKSIVSKVIYGRGSVYQFASGRCERAWNALSLLLCPRATTRLPRLLVHQLLDIQEQTTITYVLSLPPTHPLSLPLSDCI